MMKRIPLDYGAISFHWRGGRRGLAGVRWYADLYCWRRGPWRISWTFWLLGWAFSGGMETPSHPPLLQRCVTDVLWALRQREVDRG